MATGDLTPGQRSFLDHLLESPLADAFYLSGGTALAAFHLHHRRSEDLDLFSHEKFDGTEVVRLVNRVAEGEPIPHRIRHRLGFVLRVSGESLRVEFVHYDFPCLDPPQPRYRDRLRVDGLRDILANKLSTIVERTDPKDFADLLFLLRQPGMRLEEGMEDCRRKFGWPGLRLLLQTALLRVDELSGWPETEPATDLAEARRFFRNVVKELARTSL